MSRTTAWRALLPATLVALVLVALVAPANHRWHDTGLSRDVTHGGAAPFVTLPLHAAPTASRAQFTHVVHWPAWIGWAVAAVGALIVLLLVALLLSALWPLVRDFVQDLVRRLRRRPAPLLAGSDLDHDLGGYADALRARVEQAAATLRADRRTSGDSVIACWLVLEDAAAESGTARQAWQTPSEFTADLLLRHHADPAACARLLRLYQRARFGHESLSGVDTTAAADALAVIAATLHDGTGHDGTGHDGTGHDGTGHDETVGARPAVLANPDTGSTR